MTTVEQEKIQEILGRDEYRKQIGYGLRLLNQSNKTVTVLTFAYVLVTRTLASAYFGAGALGAMGIAKVLKQLLREKRPVGTTYKITYGMPSTHSATISYYATFITLAATQLPVHPVLSSIPSIVINLVVPATIITTAVVICASRIRLGHHTSKQVGAGILIGVVHGCAWFLWWSRGGAQDIAWGVVDCLPRFLKGWIR